MAAGLFELRRDSITGWWVATVVDRLSAPGLEDGYILEVFNALGDTIMVVDVPVSAVAPITADYVPAVRPLVPA